jgi:alkyl hydroperoxide reductase subunit F
MIYDLIILGAGPAGITAAVYAARKKMNFLVISKDVGGQTLWSADIENYTGYQFIAGAELVEKFREHLSQFDVQLNEPEEITLVKREDGLITVKTNKDNYQAHTVIVATGRIPRRLGVDREDEFIGKGITYCATCDAPLFAGRTVAVIGGGNSALDAVLQLDKIAEKIYLIDIAPDLAADPVVCQKARQSEKVTIYHDATVKEIRGDNFLSGIKIEAGGNEVDLPLTGLFVEIGSLPAADVVEGIKRDTAGEIMINCHTKTNIPGVFAAGDVTDVYAKQIIIACGEGAKAALASFEYLTRMKGVTVEEKDFWEA